ncbi:MAG: spermidine/putrescine ABC transporter substrate-binding protein [Gemmatimonadota bacterium]
MKANRHVPHRLNRRELLRLACLGLAGLPFAGVPGCSGRDAARVPVADLEPELNIYNWSDYIAPDTVRAFEREFGVRVSYDTYESNEELLAKLAAGAAGYDVVVPTGYGIQALLAQDLLAPLERSRLSNWDNIAPLFRDSPYDPGRRYSVPYQWGVTGIAYRADRIAAAPDSWGTFLESRYAGHMTMLDDGREVLGAMLKLRGHSYNSVNAAELAAARADAIAAKANLMAYVSAPVKGQLIAGDVWLAQLWSGDATQARVEQAEIEFVVPREGSMLFGDAMAMSRGAPHPRAAHAFMNYVLRPDVGAAIAQATGYGTPNAAAAARLTPARPYPTAAELARLEYQAELGPANALWDRTWVEVKSA